MTDAETGTAQINRHPYALVMYWLLGFSALVVGYTIWVYGSAALQGNVQPLLDIVSTAALVIAGITVPFGIGVTISKAIQGATQ